MSRGNRRKRWRDYPDVGPHGSYPPRAGLQPGQPRYIVTELRGGTIKPGSIGVGGGTSPAMTELVGFYVLDRAICHRIVARFEPGNQPRHLRKNLPPGGWRPPENRRKLAQSLADKLNAEDAAEEDDLLDDLMAPVLGQPRHEWA